MPYPHVPTDQPARPTTRAPGAHRFREIDALRGLAALNVLLFHYSVRFQEIYGFNTAPAFRFKAGANGVFFAISGYVILMSLERTQRVGDFIVSRLSRLYPTYWVALLCTVFTVSWLGLPGREVSDQDAWWNLTMLQEFLGRPNVDGAYWSLEVELVFYAWMLGLYGARRLTDIRHVVSAWLALALGVGIAGLALHREPPYWASHLLLLPYIGLYAVGIVAYKAAQSRRLDMLDGLITLAAISCVGLWSGTGPAVACVVSAVALLLFAFDKLAWLGRRPLVWVGSVAYPLYLLHQNIGYALMRSMKARGWSADASMLAALAVMLALATGIHHWIEKPASRALRAGYQRFRSQLRQAPAP